MDDLRRIGKALLFPHIAVMLLLLPIAAVFLIYSLVFLEPSSIIAVISYVLSFYTLTVWCVKIPKLIAFFRNFKNENKYVRLWTGDVRLRVRVSLYSSFLWNTAYAVFQLCLGAFHASVWYYSLAVYYICLALMRFFLSRHAARHNPGEQMKREFAEYRTCGWIFLVINLALSAMVFLMIYQDKATPHHQITTIAMAAYTFTAFTIAIINIVKYRKYESPVYSAAKAISLAAACVSMISLTSTMLASFGGEEEDPLLRTIMLAGLGAAVSIFITAMAVYMIARANKQIKQSGEPV